ncbi:MAG TPA: indole-3-glycerol-phosphate synthase [Polyangiales bacterium]|nr:indole-3-glycerol-phosphate synthase [Polyangiales bacterium]
MERKHGEVARRVRRAETFVRLASESPLPRVGAIEALRRPAGAPPRVIAEIKLRSPSAGEIRARTVGELPEIARGYARGGAAAVSVLADGPGFGGCPLDVRRVVKASAAPVLFKEFVIDSVQVDCARALGATYVLLLVRVLNDRELAKLIYEVRARGMEPVVEAADGEELTRALASEAAIVGVNARDLRSFDVDPGKAGALVDRIPASRIAVFMSGVRSAEDFQRVARTRADAVLIGEGLMRSADPGARLAELLR